MAKSASGSVLERLVEGLAHCSPYGFPREGLLQERVVAVPPAVDGSGRIASVARHVHDSDPWTDGIEPLDRCDAANLSRVCTGSQTRRGKRYTLINVTAD